MHIIVKPRSAKSKKQPLGVDVRDEATLEELKRSITKSWRLSPHRQRLTLESDQKTVLEEDEKLLKEYGVQEQTVVLLKDLGAQIGELFLCSEASRDDDCRSQAGGQWCVGVAAHSLARTSDDRTVPHRIRAHLALSFAVYREVMTRLQFGPLFVHPFFYHYGQQYVYRENYVHSRNQTCVSL